MKVKAVKCSKCRDTIFSRAQYDFRSCTCGSISIDGGLEYTRMLWKKGKMPETFELDVDATVAQLYQDWNKRINKFGLIKNKKAKKDEK